MISGNLVNMQKAAIYIRVSGGEQTEESQRQPCIDYCEEHGWTNVKVFSDHAKSAYKNVKRPQYDKVLASVRQRSINHIVVWSLDRWCRRGARELRATIDYLGSYGVQLHSVKEQWIETINMPGSLGQTFKDFLIGIIGWLAETESTRKSERVKESVRFQRALKKGKVGRPSLPDEVKKRIAALLKQGRSYSYIRNHVTYIGKYNRVHHVSDATINAARKSLSTNTR
jgi:DNA invertase Pin-like site-specific DNA recombinase